jgi:Bacterial nucleoid DNA-binding protein
MTKSELIERIVTHQGLLSSKDVELAIKTMLEQMSQCLATGDRIEIRGFGSFSLHYRAPRVGRNPRLASRSAWMANLCLISNRAKSCETG